MSISGGNQERSTETRNNQDQMIIPKFQRKYDFIDKGPRYVVKEISPHDIISKREKKIYETR